MIHTTRSGVRFLLACALPVSAEAPAASPDNPAAAPATDAPKETPAPTAKPAVPPSDRRLEHLRERLDLTPGQTEKVREILDASRREEEAAERKRAERIRELLTEEQRPAFDAMQKERASGGPRRGSGRWMGPSLEDLQRELDLTPDQREEIGTLIQNALHTVRKRFEEARAGGFQGTDWGKIRAEAEKIYTETTEKVRAALTPDQLPRYEKLLEERSRFIRHVFRRAETPAERVTRTMEALKIEKPDEAAAVKFLVERVVALQGELAAHDRASREQAAGMLKAEGMEEEAMRQRMRERRGGRTALEETLQKVRAELNQVVTVRQELELVRHGILR
jgi:Spy/CpxP family protein refolding chaperone